MASGRVLVDKAYAHRRGTGTLFSSSHLGHVLKRFSRKQLRANFFGPSEWHVLMARKQIRTRRFSPTSRNISPIDRPLIRSEKEAFNNRSEYPDGFPCSVGLDKMEAWREYRRTCAVLFPSSPFDVDARVEEAWFKFCGDSVDASLELDHPAVANIGGFHVKLVDEYASKQEILEKIPEGCSESAFRVLSELVTSCNPFSTTLKAIKLDPTILNVFETKQDVAVLLPNVLMRWRWLAMAHPSFALDSSMSDKIIQMCAQHKLFSTATDLLHYKIAFKLSPSQTAIDNLFLAMLLEIQHLAASSKSLQADDKKLEPPALPTAPTFEPPSGVKRRLSRDKHPFRMNPRYYFYKPLPYALAYESTPSLSSLELLKLPAASLPPFSFAHRLLPDDQRKAKQVTYLDQAKYMSHLATYRHDLEISIAKMEGCSVDVMKQVNNMWTLFAGMLSSSPMVRYPTFSPSMTTTDALVLGGRWSQTKEGRRRSLETVKEIIGQTEAWTKQDGVISSLCLLELIETMNQEGSIHVNQVLSVLDKPSVVNIGGSSVLLRLGATVMDPSTFSQSAIERKSVPMNESQQVLADKILSTFSNTVVPKLDALKATDANLFVRIRNMLRQNSSEPVVAAFMAQPAVQKVFE